MEECSNELRSFRSRVLESISVRLHVDLALPLPPAHHGIGLVPGEDSLTAYTVSADRKSLVFASIWWPMGFMLTTTYFIFISRRFAGKVSVDRDDDRG